MEVHHNGGGDLSTGCQGENRTWNQLQAGVLTTYLRQTHLQLKPSNVGKLGHVYRRCRGEEDKLWQRCG
jgi:hypothetical protein